VEWPLPLGEEGEKRGVGDPRKRNNSTITTRPIKKRKTRQTKTTKVSIGRG
jgi:hypothetical protein